MKCFLLFMFIFLAACAPHKHQLSIDPVAKLHYDSFIAEAAAQRFPLRIDDLTIRLGDLGEATTKENFTVARCITSFNTTPEIIINTNEQLGPKMFSVRSSTIQQEIVWHEMAHCVLGREHLSSKFTGSNEWGQIPVSIMYPGVLPDDVLIHFSSHFNRELFHPTVHDAE